MLWKHQPESDAAKLVYIRGILASLSYGGIGKDKFAPGLLEYLSKNENRNNVLQKLSPLIHSKLHNNSMCERWLKKLKVKAAGAYLDWLNSLKCSAHNK